MKSIAKLLALIAVVVMIGGCSEVDEYVRDFKNTTTEQKDLKSIKSEKSRTNPVSAKEWYLIAKNEADKWADDNVFIGAVGASTAKDGEKLAVDGRTDQWSYQFVSFKLNKKLRIFVQEGELGSKDEEGIGEDQGVKIDDYKGLKTDDEWKIDSDAAVQKTNEEFKKDFPEDTPEEASYVYFNLKRQNVSNDTFTPMMLWTVSYDQQGAGAKISLDAVSGDILPD